jgi:hypothetical protein
MFMFLLLWGKETRRGVEENRIKWYGTKQLAAGSEFDQLKIQHRSASHLCFNCIPGSSATNRCDNDNECKCRKSHDEWLLLARSSWERSEGTATVKGEEDEESNAFDIHPCGCKEAL